jgi:rare lipoprotein A
MKTTILFLTFMLLSFLNTASAQDKAGKPGSKIPQETPAKRVKKTAKIQYGMASFYHNKFQGRKTSSGEKYDQDKMTAAHNGLPMNTWIRVTNIKNGRSVVVKINDRLHHRNERLVDLSRSAASKLGYIGRGLARVKVEVLGKIKPTEIAKKDL